MALSFFGILLVVCMVSSALFAVWEMVIKAFFKAYEAVECEVVETRHRIQWERVERKFTPCVNDVREVCAKTARVLETARKREYWTVITEYAATIGVKKTYLPFRRDCMNLARSFRCRGELLALAAVYEFIEAYCPRVE